MKLGACALTRSQTFSTWDDAPPTDLLQPAPLPTTEWKHGRWLGTQTPAPAPTWLKIPLSLAGCVSVGESLKALCAGLLLCKRGGGAGDGDNICRMQLLGKLNE